MLSSWQFHRDAWHADGVSTARKCSFLGRWQGAHSSLYPDSGLFVVSTMKSVQSIDCSLSSRSDVGNVSMRCCVVAGRLEHVCDGWRDVVVAFGLTVDDAFCCPTVELCRRCFRVVLSSDTQPWRDPICRNTSTPLVLVFPSPFASLLLLLILTFPSLALPVWQTSPWVPAACVNHALRQWPVLPLPS